MDPILFFDLETTGPDPLRDRIVQMAFLSEERAPLSALVDPLRPIPPAATKVHGVTDEMVAGRAPFRDWAWKVQELVDTHVLVGYNSRNFDQRVLDAELQRCGERGVGEEHPCVDAYVLWNELEKRTLDNALLRFGVRRVGDAHDALSDAAAARDLTAAMARHFKIDLEAAVRVTLESSVTKYAEARDGEWCWRFGKNRGQPILDDPDYASWVLGKDFPPALKRLVRKVLDGTAEAPA